MKIRVYTDGACSGNPGAGGWASVLHLKDGAVTMQGCEANTTNNRMELMAVVETLNSIMEGKHGICKKDKIEICSDSAYVVNAVNGKWVVKWKLNGWKTTKGKDVKNRDLWESLFSLIASFKEAGFQVRFVKVKGHNGDCFNEMADKLAKEQAEKAKLIAM